MFPNNFYNSDYYGAWGGASEDPQSNQNLPQYGVSGTGMGAYSTGFPSHQQPQGGSFSSSAREIYNALPASHYPYGSFEARSPEVNYEALVSSPERIDLDSVLQGNASLSQSVQQNIHQELGSINHGGSQEVDQSSRGFMHGRHRLGLERDSQSRVGGAEQAESSQGVTLTETESAFMNALPHYASGKPMKECELGFGRPISSYFGNWGLQRDGVRIYNNLSQPMKDEVDTAIAARRHVLFGGGGMSGMSPNQEYFLRALELLALGVTLRECEKQTKWKALRNYVSSKGVLTDRGKRLLNSLPSDSQASANNALTARKTWYAKSNLDGYLFLAAMKLFANKTWSVEEVANQMGGMDPELLGLVLCDTGLTDVGRQYVCEMLPPDQWGVVDHYIARRRQG